MPTAKIICYQKISTNQTSKQNGMTTKLYDIGLKSFQNLVEHEGFCESNKFKKAASKGKGRLAVWQRSVHSWAIDD